MIRQLLQGRPFGHPLHTLLVHFPIGLLLLSFVLDLVSYAAPATAWTRASLLVMTLGVVTAVLAAVPGLADYTSIRRDHPGRKTATTHLLLNLLIVGLYVVSVL